jgi:two-component system sensor histidine kinase YesM
VYSIFEESKGFIVCDYFEEVWATDPNQEATEFFRTQQPDSAIYSADIYGEKHIIAQYYSKVLGLTYYQALPERLATKESNVLKIWYSVFSVVVVMIAAIYTTYIYWAIKRPINILAKSLKEVQNENFHFKIEHKKKDEFSFVYQAFNEMTERLDTLINEVYVQKLLSQKSEFRQMQAQINPHFLYNSFFILRKRLSQKQYDDASAYCDMLGKYFEYITKNYDDYSTLGQETKHARLYAELQLIRFRDRVDIEFADLPAEYEDWIIPKLILQPVIENAFKYGLEGKAFDGFLRVGFTVDDEYVDICVEDNGDTFLGDNENLQKLNSIFEGIDDLQEIRGLLNIHKRIQIFSEDKESGVFFSQSELGGLKVTLHIRKGKRADDNKISGG